MADSELEMLYKQHRTMQDKYTYFLLAVTASAVAFVVQKTTGLKLSWSMFPLALAVLSWIGSFYFGCRNLHYAQASVYANFHYLHSTKKEQQNVSIHNKKVTKKNIDIAERYSKCQFALLLIGVAFFLWWHIQEMNFLTINT